jgi:hypothetical protein
MSKEESSRTSSSFCIKCFKVLYPGCRHPCNFGDKIDNLKNIVPPRLLQIATVESTPLQKNGQGSDVLQLATRGRNATFQKVGAGLKTKKKDEKVIPHEIFDNIKLVTGMSNNNVLKVAKEIRQICPIVSNLHLHLADLNKKFKDLFIEESISHDEFTYTMVYCTDISAFFTRILDERGVSREDIMVRLSIDDGRGFLKVSGSLVFLNQQKEVGLFLSSGVKRTHILALASVKETSSTIKKCLIS